MTPFLYRIASTFYKTYGDDLQQFAFVFPNRRSGLFFRYFLAQVAGKPIFSPPVYTINNLMAEFSSWTPVDRIEALFILYEEYSRLRHSDEPFDKFVYWGEMLAGDFDDIDKYMVDASRLLTNVKDLKEIESDYLTEEQLAVIQQFWHSFLFPHHDSDKKTSFASLWEILHDLYACYRTRLADEGLAYEGMIFRDVATRAREGKLQLPQGITYVFIGFNAITEAERELMRYLQREQRADFYWDHYAPTLQDDDNKAVYFLNNNRKQFPSLLDIGEECFTDTPEITVIPLSTGVGQAKQAGEILRTLAQDGTIDPHRAMNTAIVLPDEEMLVPMLYSIPAAYDDINITMGYALKNTPAATLIENIQQMQKHIRWSQGKALFYHVDVMTILNHPFVKATVVGQAKEIIDDMVNYNRTYIAADRLQTCPLLQLVFRPVASATEASGYLLDILDYLLRPGEANGETEGDTTETTEAKIEREYLYHYRMAVTRLQDVMNAHCTEPDIFTYLALLSKITAGISIPFRGEPLSGLQIMGVLETRVLDFENVIILSMNEGVFPAKIVANSFIPYNLRRGYGMATTEHQDSIYAYYFYRLIGRARRVFLIYDCRTDGLKKGEMSRYIYQLKYHYSRILPRLQITEQAVSYTVGRERPFPVSIAKTPRVMKLLDAFSVGSDEGRKLSASAVNTYIACPLKFYLQYVEGLKPDYEITEDVDSGAFGSIYHGVMSEVYNRMQAGSRKPVLVTADMIDGVLAPKGDLSQITAKWFAHVFYHKGMDEAAKVAPPKGQHLIVTHLVEQYVRRTLKHDKQMTPFTYIASELRIDDGCIVTADGKRIAFKAFIDRVDMVGDTVRIVDYKTGGDNTAFAEVSQLFDPLKIGDVKAVNQLCLYCRLYGDKYPDENRPLQPIIYKLRTNFSDGVAHEIKQGEGRNKDTISDFDAIAQAYNEALEQCVTEIFDPEVPFAQSPCSDYCQWCDFAGLCRRTPDSDES